MLGRTAERERVGCGVVDDVDLRLGQAGADAEALDHVVQHLRLLGRDLDRVRERDGRPHRDEPADQVDEDGDDRAPTATPGRPASG